MRFPCWFITTVLGAALLALAACTATATPTSSGLSFPTRTPIASNGLPTAAPNAPNATTAPAPPYGQPSKTSGCRADGALPDAACTPGDVLPATREAICTSGYARSVRNVPVEEKAAVYRAYGIARHSPGQYEVDHLISLELGGANTIANLWPEAAAPQPGFHEKDEVENYLHDQICSGAIALADAQRLIAGNWLEVYQHLHGGAALPVPAAPSTQAVPTEIDAAPDSSQVGDPSDSTNPNAQSASSTDGSCPANLPVKGNVRRDGTRIYHLPQEGEYARTHAELCFANAAAAEAAGFRAPRGR